jgi:hypothetical protein
MKPESRAIAAGTGSLPAPTRRSKLWLWFVAAFLVQAVVWTTWLTIASHHRVQEVPLAPAR